MDKMREEFEEWMRKYWFEPNLSKDRLGYENEIASQQWQAWQASRQTLVVQLPLWRHYNGVQAYDMSEVKQSIEDAGIKWKS